jgi:ABC-2 type transport system ATP-binding protein
MENEVALAVGRVSKTYGTQKALDAVNFSVPKGKVFGLLGPNGAGKTTLLRMLNGITEPDSGSISFFGEALSRRHLPRIGYLPEERGLYKTMRVGEQALYFAQLRGLEKEDARVKLMHWFEKLEVDGWWNKEVSEVSKGMAQKIQFILAILYEPDLLILDEPLSGFDPINAQRVRSTIQELSESGETTILLSTHDMGSVEEMCDEVALLHEGNLILQGSVQSLRDNARDGQFQVTFRGTVMEFSVAIGASAELLNVVSDAPRVGEHTALIRLSPTTDQSTWIHWISGEVKITSCSEWQPSMRDVFIQAVGKTSSAVS